MDFLEQNNTQNALLKSYLIVSLPILTAIETSQTIEQWIRIIGICQTLGRKVIREGLMNAEGKLWGWAGGGATAQSGER